MADLGTGTPALQALKAARVAFQVHSYEHDPRERAFGAEAARKLAVPEGQVFKTLIVALSGGTKSGESSELACAVVPVSAQLNLKALAHALGAKKAEMAPPSAAQRRTGYVLGAVSPLGQKNRLSTIVDESAAQWETIFCSGGRRGLEIELAPADLLQLIAASYAPIAA